VATKIKVLVVDDSAVIRKLLSKIITSCPDMELVGAAPDPFVAREMIVQHKPDVMTLDVEMPKMDGISFLERVMQHLPIRTLIISSLAKEGSETALRALEVGAIDVVEKPSLDVTKSLEAMTEAIASKIRMAARARVQKMAPIASRPQHKSKLSVTAMAKTTHQVLAIASSTGGTEALKVVLAGLPADLPGTVIVQHMPAGFTKTYSESLNSKFPFEVKEAEDGDKVVPGRVLVAPGNFHMEIVRNGAFYHIKLHQQPLLHGVRPAADFLMKSVAKYVGGNAIGVVLTGMGKDGAEGLLEMKKAGAYTLSQSERTCVVYGMPHAAEQIGAVDKVMDLDQISTELCQQFQKRAA
jgi:two-component system, chemotaxis family, protein-glutamate methylesterase/glutaminase